MQLTLFILIGACLFIVIAIFMVQIFLAGKKHKHQHQQLEKMLDQVAAKEAERKSSLLKFLVENQVYQEQQAMELSSELIAEEKKYLLAFMQQQLSQQEDSDIYNPLCQLLDSYMRVAAGRPPESTQNTTDREADTGSTDTEEEVADGQEQAIQSDDNKADDETSSTVADTTQEEMAGEDKSEEAPGKTLETKDEAPDASPTQQPAGTAEIDVEALLAEGNVMDEAQEQANNQDEDINAEWEDAFEEAGIPMEGDTENEQEKEN